ncbi:MAG: alanine--tRNA ligase [Ectothiorhodospiraceae bacterium]|nr:alanine--tRNA ligase [Ectothiorhodospiraceae bacterium]
MTSSEIRQSFLDFFRGKDHRIVQSAPVVPHDDPTLLFTNAGMNQFKDVFLGVGTRDYNRAADTQKCIRVSGKHNDLEEVGIDTYHHTFFEMLGNWSFGDYYKSEAITWAWELLTEVWKLPKERLYATVYKDDDEAFDLWKELTDIDPSHIQRFGEKDNFWEMGETGPCGPCSEIHIDLTEDLSGAALVNKGVPEVIEIWNLVFIQYNRDESGTLTDLPAKHVDTGMGFERICAVLQGKTSNYDSDVFTPVIERIAELSGKKYEGEANQVAMRVIADHVRMLTFSIADGAMPGPEGRGYVLRRILRRGARFGRNLGLKEPFMWKIVATVTKLMAEVFPEIEERREIIEKVVRAEEESFGETLDRGLEIFEEILAAMKKEDRSEMSGAEAFKLYDTFGFPLDLTSLLARERGKTIDVPGFEKHLQEQKERSRSATKNKMRAAGKDGGLDIQMQSDAQTEFIGYDSLETESEIAAVGEMVKTDDGLILPVVLERTPFYLEAGGQISDTGSFVADSTTYDVTGLTGNRDQVVHLLLGDESLEQVRDEQMVIAKVDARRRWDIMRNHTVTHLLHQALREVLGTHVQQAGSYVGPDRLRFDFSHFQKVSPEDLADIESRVNEKILEAISVQHHRNVPFDEAKEMGALMFFGDKYGDTVNVIQIADYSLEFCGGTHVKNTSQIGLFKIVSEGSIASGTRRIEAVTGRGVYNFIGDLEQKIEREQEGVSELQDKIKSLEKEMKKLAIEQSDTVIEDFVANAESIGVSKIVVAKVDAENMDELKGMGDKLREKLSSGIGLLAAAIDEKVALVCVVSDDLVSGKSIKAGALVGQIAKMLGGGGGGRPHLATAGAKDVEKLDEALKTAGELFKEQLT